MLILTRRTGESIVVGDDAIITILNIKGNQVRVGVVEPKKVYVHSEEIHHNAHPEKGTELKACK